MVLYVHLSSCILAMWFSYFHFSLMVLCVMFDGVINWASASLNILSLLVIPKFPFNLRRFKYLKLSTGLTVFDLIYICVCGCVGFCLCVCVCVCV